MIIKAHDLEIHVVDLQVSYNETKVLNCSLFFCSHLFADNYSYKMGILNIISRPRLHNFLIKIGTSNSLMVYPVDWGCRIHRLHLCREVRLPQRVSCSPVGWGCKIHRLHLCREIRLPQRVSKTIRWWSFSNLELWGMWSTHLLPLLQGPLCPSVVAPNWILSMGQIELNCVLMLNWIAWNRTVLTFKLCTYAKLNCLKWSCFCMLNWIVWNEAVFVC